ncbi:MAG: hypothetical protein HQL37_03470 [Alphaproteobacteria bacterium]|nr:hypothetical protein [Alphaproteobacteria bacterium]
MAESSCVGAMVERRTDHATRNALTRVRHTLEGSVTDIFRLLIPELRKKESPDVYETIMHDPALVEKCLKIFRERRDLFSSFLLDKDGRMISADNIPLPCGRTVEQVIGLVVRALAKRYFRDHIKPQPLVVPTKTTIGSCKEFLHSLIVTPPPPPVPHGSCPLSPADALYAALSDFLLYEWQVPLVPHYTPLPVPVVKTLGKRILDLREVEELRYLAKTGSLKTSVAAKIEIKLPKPAIAAVPNASPDIQSPPKPDDKSAVSGENKMVEIMWQHSQAMELPALFNVDESEMRRILAHVASVGAHVRSSLATATSGLPGLLVVLCTIDRSLGHALMRTNFGETANITMVNDLVALLKESDVKAMNDATPIREAVERCLVQLQTKGHLRPESGPSLAKI